MPVQRIGVVGLGLIGGSLARDFAGRGMRVLGFDRDESTLNRALAAGAVQASLGRRLERLADVDVLLIAVPVDAALDVLRAVAASPASCMVMDVGSTKVSIVELANSSSLRTRFIGAHPLTGDHRSGWEAARTGLFQDATVYLSPASDVDPGMVQRAERLWALLGARTTRIAADVHDERMAWASHLPQVVSSALAGVLTSAGITRDQLGPGGRDATRLAASDAAMWTPVLLDNRTNVSSALGRFAGELDSLRRALDTGDAGAIRGFIEAGRQLAAAERPDAGAP